MTKTLLIYDRPEPIAQARHGELSVQPIGSLPTARGLTAVPIAAPEIPSVAAEMPVVFAGREVPVPVAVLGLRPGENLMLDGDERWDGRYCPAFLRQYPFVLGGAKGSKDLALCIDGGYGGLNREGKGERLFDADGQRTQYVQRALDFTVALHRDFNRTRTLCAQLRDSQLLETAETSFPTPQGPARVHGYEAVSRDKLNALPGEELAKLAKTGALELLYTHLASLKQFEGLVRRQQARDRSRLEAAEAGRADVPLH